MREICHKKTFEKQENKLIFKIVIHFYSGTIQMMENL